MRRGAGRLRRGRSSTGELGDTRRGEVQRQRPPCARAACRARHGRPPSLPHAPRGGSSSAASAAERAAARAAARARRGWGGQRRAAGEPHAGQAALCGAAAALWDAFREAATWWAKALLEGALCAAAAPGDARGARVEARLLLQREVHLAPRLPRTQLRARGAAPRRGVVRAEPVAGASLWARARGRRCARWPSRLPGRGRGLSLRHLARSTRPLRCGRAVPPHALANLANGFLKDPGRARSAAWERLTRHWAAREGQGARKWISWVGSTSGGPAWSFRVDVLFSL